MTGTGRQSVARRGAQRGTALFLGLALLLAISAGALSGALTTTLELRMSRNSHDMARAFQAAEAALAEAEARLEIAGGAKAPVYPGPRYGEVAGWRDPAAWQTHATTARMPLAGVLDPPQVLVERATILGGDNGELPVEPVVDVFRVTAVAFAGSRSASVWLQSTYAVARDRAHRRLNGRLSWIELES